MQSGKVQVSFTRIVADPSGAREVINVFEHPEHPSPIASDKRTLRWRSLNGMI
jgi:hypothetical protein